VSLLNQKTGRTWNSHFVPKAPGISEGNLILSTYAFSSTSSRYLSYTRSIAQATINVGGRNINFFATHLDHTSSTLRLTEAGELLDWTSGFAAPRIVAEHMAHAMFAGRPEFVLDALGRWSFQPLAVAYDGGAGERPSAVKEASPPTYAGRRNKRGRRGDYIDPSLPPQPLAGLSYVVVDVETTGGPPPHHRITEIAAVIVRNGEIQEVFETLVNPERSIPPFVSRLTNITWDMVKDAPKFSAIGPDLLEKLEGNVFVAHNAQFDWSFLSHEIQRASGARISGNQLCTVRLARRLLPHLPKRSLDYVANYFGIEISGRHRAAGDAIATAHCLVRLLREAENRGCTTWDDLDRLLRYRASRKKKRRSAFPSPVNKDLTA
jgi:DNA polymerase-3 subunit epsilon